LINKPRKPWLAGILTFITIGLGHLYYGDIKKGIILFIGGQLLLILALSFFLFYAPVGPIIAIIGGISYIVYCINDSIRGANQYKLSYSIKKYNRWYFYLLFWFVASFVIQAIVGTAIKSNIAQAYNIPSGGMMQTLLIGDNIIADKFTYKTSTPRRGDIVIFPFPEDPSKDFLQRIIALNGESIEIIDKKILINGKILHEPYATHKEKRILPQDLQPRDNFGPVRIPDDSVFVMGDNRDNSYDSRYWGFVKKSSIKGKAVNIYWSWDKENLRVRWDRIGKKIK
jgi:signal peptidase I